MLLKKARKNIATEAVFKINFRKLLRILDVIQQTQMGKSTVHILKKIEEEKMCRRFYFSTKVTFCLMSWAYIEL